MILPAFNISRQKLRGNHLTLGLFLFGIFASYILSIYIINEDTNGLALIGLATAASALVVTILNSWRNGLLILITWLLFEDFARKYLGNNMAIYFAKDVLASVVYLSFFVATRKEKTRLFRPPFRIPLLLMIWFGALQVFNPASGSIFFGLMGFKIFFFYVPLMVVGYAYFTSEQNLCRFFFLNIVLLLIISSLGVAQSILGHTFLNPENMQDDIRELATSYRVSPISGLSSYRPTSVFVSSGRYVNFLGVGWVLVLGFLGYLLFRPPKGRMLAFFAVVSTAAALVLTSSRGAFVWGLIGALVFSIAFLWGAPWRNGEVIRVLRMIQRTTLGIIAAFIFLIFLFPDALESRLSFYYETMSPKSLHSELAARSWDYPVQNFLGAFDYERWPYGYGIGTAGLGTQYVSRIFHVKPPDIGVESGFGAIVLQMGIVGLFLWLIMSIAILFSAWRVVSQLRGSIWFPLGFAIFWFVFLVLIPYTFGGIVAYEDFVLNAYLWVLLGILFRLPDFAASEKLAVEARNKS
jgi:hypothetical protein